MSIHYFTKLIVVRYKSVSDAYRSRGLSGDFVSTITTATIDSVVAIGYIATLPSPCACARATMLVCNKMMHGIIIIVAT